MPKSFSCARAFAIGGASAALLLGASVSASAHHGWGWYGDDHFEVTGTVEDVNLGGPHGALKVRVDGELWDVVLAPPNANARAGLTNLSQVPIGAVVTARGHRWKDDDGRLEIKTERLTVGQHVFNVYNRD